MDARQKAPRTGHEDTDMMGRKVQLLADIAGSNSPTHKTTLRFCRQ